MPDTHDTHDTRALDATDDLVTGRHRDAAGREHDLVTEATAEAAAGTTGGPVGHDHGADVPAGTGVVTDRHADTGE